MRVTFEMEPATRWCAAQTALYRVGEPVDLMPSPDSDWTPALAGMLRPKYLPALVNRSKRRRWVGHVCLEESADLRLPLHERPAFVRFVVLSQLLAGGGAVDNVHVFGEQMEQAVALKFLLDNARSLHENGPQRPDDEVGTFFAGDVNLTGAHGMTDIADLVKRGLDRPEFGRRLRLLEDVAREAMTDAIAQQSVAMTLSPELTGYLGQPLDYESARTLAADGRVHGVSPERMADTLLLSGFVNGSGHRSWYRANAVVAGGWDV